MLNFNWKNIETIEDLVENPKGTILYLHAFSGNYKNKIILRNFLKDFNFYALNMPGHGNSKFNSENEIDYYFYKDLIIEYVKKNDLKNFVLIGHSMGGGLSILVNNEIKDRIKKVILETPSNPQALSEVKIIPKLIPDNFEEMQVIGSELFYEPIKFFGNELNYQRFLKKEFVNLSKKKYLKKLIQKNVLEELSISLKQSITNLTAPTLMILGKYDEIVPANITISFFKKYLHNIKIEVLENSKHVPIAEESSLILPKILEFISE